VVPRQLWLFQLGCWIALVTAGVHMAAHVTGSLLSTASGIDPASTPPVPTHIWLVPGLWQPTFAGVLDGFSLTVAMLTATIGAAGLVVLRFGEAQPELVRRVARVFALGMTMCLVVGILSMFSAETFFVAITALCFGLASVKPE
jgi:hypothetical protein